MRRSTPSARRDDWVEEFLREPDLLNPVSRWDYLPRDVKALIMHFERHRLAMDMIHRIGLALPNVKPCPRKDYDKLDFTDYIAYFMEGTRRNIIATKKRAILYALRDHITAASFAVSWLAFERPNAYHSSKHDSGCGFYAHLSWLCWTKRGAWFKKPSERRAIDELLSNHCIAREVFEERKINFEALNLFCTPDALRKANIALIDYGKLQ